MKQEELTKHPLVVIETILPFTKIDDELVKTNTTTKSLVRIEHKNLTSDFYFEIESCEFKNGAIRYLIKHKPKNRQFVSERNIHAEAKEISRIYEDWKKHLVEYTEVAKKFDPILSQYEKEFYSQYDIIDDDAETNTFDFNTQILFDNFLEHVIIKIDGYISTTSDPEEKRNAEELKNEAILIRKEIPILTKKLLFKKISQLYAKLRKVSLSLIKDAFLDAKQGITKFLKGKSE